MGLIFSSDPSDDEFLRTGLFAQPLVPVGATSADENRALAQALRAYGAEQERGHLDAVSPILDFLAAHPRSAWEAALRLDLGAVYRHTGHFSRAFETWQAAWALTKDRTDSSGRALGDSALASLSQFEAYLGRKELLEPLLEEAKARPIRGAAAELVSESARGLADMLSRPDESFKCGPSALARILSTLPTPPRGDSHAVLMHARSTPNGLSLTMVRDISAEAGMGYQMAFREHGATVIVPAVAHWNMGHYAAILGSSGGSSHVGDATFGEDIVLSTVTLEEETSGYFLVPAAPLPAGWRAVDDAEGDTVWGRGDTGQNHDNGATGAQEIHAFPCPPGGGCTTWNVEAMVGGLSLHDDPVGYTPPVGPAIRFPVDYSHRDALQPPVFTYANLGNKWTFGWLSYVIAHDSCAGFYGSFVDGYVGGSIQETDIQANTNDDCAMLYRRGGGGEPYVYPLETPPIPDGGSTLQLSGLGQYSQAILTQIKDASSGVVTGYVRALPDGSIERFDQQMGAKYFFLTELDDPQGNAVTIRYDGSMRVVSVTDAIGQATTLCYSDSWRTTHQCLQPVGTMAPQTNLEVTQVVDPFGRSALFGYDATTGHLTSITDVLGITSVFHYQDGSDFIDTLTTPYGTSQFAFADSTNDLDTSDATRSVTIVDPLGRTSYVEYHQGTTDCHAASGGDAAFVDSNGIPCVDTVTPLGMPTSLTNENLEYRNTFVWNPYQYTDPPNYASAKVVHWLHTNADGDSDTNPLVSSRIPESIKEPLEHRVWFTYPNQDHNEFAGNLQASMATGATNQPTGIGRVLDDGTTQLSTYTYNGYGKVTTATDPVGRQVTMTYDTNGIDLLSVFNTTEAVTANGNVKHEDLLVTLGGYNGHHEPTTVTATNGQVTRLTYNAQGQTTSITDPLGTTRVYDYAGGYLQRVEASPHAPPGHQAIPVPLASFTYDAYGRVSTATDAAFTTHSYFYDDADRLTRVVFPDQTTQVYAYTLLDLTGFTDRRQNQTTRRFDADRELTEVAEPARTTTFGYYTNGLLLSVQDPLGDLPVTYGRDLEGRVTSVVNNGTFTNIYTYDGAGRMTDLEQLEPTVDRDVHYTYSVDDTVAAMAPAAELPTFYVYDPAYKRLAAWYQAPALPTALLDATVQSGEAFTYNPVTSPPALGANRLAEDTTLTTNQLPATNEVRPNVSTSSYAYDALDRAISRAFVPAVVPRAPLVQSVTYIETWAYDYLGRLTSDDNPLDAFSLTYADPTSRVRTRSSAAGPQVTAQYYGATGDELLQQLTYSSTSGAQLAQYAYQYDANHNVSTFGEAYPGASVSTTYAYDVYNQLKSAKPTKPEQVDQNGFTYDVAGNRISATTEIPNAKGVEVPYAAVGVTYNARNETAQTTTTLVQGNQSTVGVATFDADGDLVFTGSGATYVYDDLDRLKSLVDGTNVSYFYYDGVGRLVQIVDFAAGVMTANHSYVWCGSVRCAELDNTWQSSLPGYPGETLEPEAGTAANADKLYFSEGMVKLAYSPEFGALSSKAYYVTDLLGSVREVVDDTAAPSGPTVLSRYEYGPYGNAAKVGGTGLDSDFGFAGYYAHRASGLDFAMNRAYAPLLGRWLTEDPLGPGVAFLGGPGFSATDLNVYAYAGNNPTSYVDPSGNCPLCIPVAIGIILAYGALAPSDTSEAPANLAALAIVTSGGFGALGAVGGAGGCAAGAAGEGLGTEASAAKGAVDANKLLHIFGNAEHNLEPVVDALGSEEAAFSALQAATEEAVGAQGSTGVFETVVEVAGEEVTVRGAVVDGAVRIGTAFIP